MNYIRQGLKDLKTVEIDVLKDRPLLDIFEANDALSNDSNTNSVRSDVVIRENSFKVYTMPYVECGGDFECKEVGFKEAFKIGKLVITYPHSEDSNGIRNFFIKVPYSFQIDDLPLQRSLEIKSRELSETIANIIFMSCTYVYDFLFGPCSSSEIQDIRTKRVLSSFPQFMKRSDRIYKIGFPIPHHIYQQRDCLSSGINRAIDESLIKGVSDQIHLSYGASLPIINKDNVDINDSNAYGVKLNVEDIQILNSSVYDKIPLLILLLFIKYVHTKDPNLRELIIFVVQTASKRENANIIVVIGSGYSSDTIIDFRKWSTLAESQAWSELFSLLSEEVVLNINNTDYTANPAKIIVTDNFVDTSTITPSTLYNSTYRHRLINIFDILNTYDDTSLLKYQPIAIQLSVLDLINKNLMNIGFTFEIKFSPQHLLFYNVPSNESTVPFKADVDLYIPVKKGGNIYLGRTSKMLNDSRDIVMCYQNSSYSLLSLADALSSAIYDANQVDEFNKDFEGRIKDQMGLIKRLLPDIRPWPLINVCGSAASVIAKSISLILRGKHV